jgi:hypothetical protein
MVAVAAPPTCETMAEAPHRTGVSTRTIRRRIGEGRLTGHRFGPPQGFVCAVRHVALKRLVRPSAVTASATRSSA